MSSRRTAISLPNEVTGMSIPTSCALKQIITIPQHDPTKSIRSNSDIHKEPNTSEKVTSQDASGVTSHQFQTGNTAISLFSQPNRTQRSIPMYNSYSDYIYRTQNNQIVTNQSHRSNDQTFLVNTITTTVLTLSKPQLAMMRIADTYSLSSTNNIPFQTKTYSNATANPRQTLYQQPTAHNISPSA